MRRGWIGPAIGIGLVLVVPALLWFLVLPWTANHYAFALPGPGGLPYRVEYGGRSYMSQETCARAGWCDGGHSMDMPGPQSCTSPGDLPPCAGSPMPTAAANAGGYTSPHRCRQWSQLPDLMGGRLVEVGRVPTLFGPARALLAVDRPSGAASTPTAVAVREDGDCYVLFSLSGGP